MSTTPQTLGEAFIAIETILAALPDHSLPKPDRIEPDDGKYGPCAWFDNVGTGYHLGHRTKNGSPNPGGGHRQSGVWDALVREAAYRLDIKHCAEVER